MNRPLDGTHCAYPRKDGQAELTWMVGHLPYSLAFLDSIRDVFNEKCRSKIAVDDIQEEYELLLVKDFDISYFY